MSRLNGVAFSWWVIVGLMTGAAIGIMIALCAS